MCVIYGYCLVQIICGFSDIVVSGVNDCPIQISIDDIGYTLFSHFCFQDPGTLPADISNKHCLRPEFVRLLCVNASSRFGK